MPKITVIVPVYKVENYINKCVDSILGQSFQDFDLVLVDDGSPDTCPRICDAYAEKDARIKVIHKKNGGLSDARNAGIDWAMDFSDSQWLAFVDSDDRLHEDYLKTLYDTAVKENADLVVCDFVRVNEQGEEKIEEHNFYDLVSEDKQELFKLLFRNWRIVPAWNKLYHKHIFSELRFAFGKIHEDEFAIHHVLWNCKRAAFISDCLYIYLIRKNGIMRTETPRSILDGIEALVERYEFELIHDVIPPDTGITLEQINYNDIYEPDFDKAEMRRYKKLKARFARVYFVGNNKPGVKRLVGSLFPHLYSKIGKKSRAKDKR